MEALRQHADVPLLDFLLRGAKVVFKRRGKPLHHDWSKKMSNITRNHALAAAVSALLCIVYAIATTHQAAGSDGQYTFWFAAVLLALSALGNLAIAVFRHRARI